MDYNRATHKLAQFARKAELTQLWNGLVCWIWSRRLVGFVNSISMHEHYRKLAESFFWVGGCRAEHVTRPTWKPIQSDPNWSALGGSSGLSSRVQALHLGVFWVSGWVRVIQTILLKLLYQTAIIVKSWFTMCSWLFGRVWAKGWTRRFS